MTDFRAGEVSPSLRMRVDSKAYVSGCRSLKNALIRNTGAVERRPGTKMLAQAGDASSGVLRLTAFEFDEEEAYLCMFQSNKLYIYDTIGGGAGDVVDSFSGSTDCPWTSTVRSYAQSGNTAIICDRAFQPKVLKRTALDTFTIEDFAFDADTDIGVTYQPFYKYEDDDVALDVATPTVVRSGTSNIIASSAIFSSAWVGKRIRIHGNEFEITSYTNTTTVVGTLRSNDFYVTLDPNPMRFENGSGRVEILWINHGMSEADSVRIEGAFVDSTATGIAPANINGTFAIDEVIDEDRFTIVAAASDTASDSFDGGGPNVRIAPDGNCKTWVEQTFSDHRGWPGAVVFHEGRLWFGGTDELPDGLWSSKTGKYFNFDVGDGLDTDSIQLLIGSTSIPQIRHLVSNQSLEIYTDGAEYIARRADNVGITPSNITIQRETPYGVNANVQPKVFDGATLYVQASGETIREFIYEVGQDRNVSTDLTTISNHLINSPLGMDVLYGSARPEQYAFVVNLDGTLAVFHSIRNEGLAAWVPWETRALDLFTDVCVVLDRVFFVCYRYVNGSQRYYLEMLDFENEVYLDAHLVTTTSINSPNYERDLNDFFPGVYTHFPFANESVSWVGRTGGASAALQGVYYMGERTWETNGIWVVQPLTSGAPDPPFSLIWVGHDYTFEVIPLSPDIAMGDGQMTGSYRRISAVTCHFLDTYNVKVDDETMITWQAGFSVDEEPDAVTGKHLFYLAGWDRDPVVTITQTAPVKITLLGLIMEVSI